MLDEWAASQEPEFAAKVNRHSPTFGRECVPTLARDHVHVWRVSTAGNDCDAFAEILSPEERARAARFHFERDRRSFIVCRGTLRRLISSYTGEDPGGIRFDIGLQGKPSLPQAHESGLRFNVAHSGELALLAFARNQEIGVDVEFKRMDVDFIGLAETSFSREERAAIVACAPADRGNLFYEYWTCKEACIKADGRGLSIPLDQFSVIAPGDQPQWREIVVAEPGTFPSRMWSRILEVGDDYSAALVTNAPSQQVLQLDTESP